MRTKHFIHEPTGLVEAALSSVALTNPGVDIDLANKTVYRRAHGDAQRVSLVSGGGAGHEPAFAGYVGPGLLSAAVSGTVFASPSSRQVLAAIEHELRAGRSVAVLVMNYTGDVLNFGVAVEKARAKWPRAQLEMIVVGDDVGVPRAMAGKVGRRGIAGTVLVLKAIGAMAELGFGLEEICKVSKVISDNLVSVGASLERVHVPGQEQETTLLNADEVEVGMGIHNEAGAMRVNGDKAGLQELVREMLRQLLDKDDIQRNFISQRSDDMVLLVNNLGSVSPLEMGAITKEVSQQLQDKCQKRLKRVYSGTFMTSLNGPGFSISLLNVVDLDVKHSLLQLLDTPTDAAGWNPVSWAPVETDTSHASRYGEASQQASVQDNLIWDIPTVRSRLSRGLEALISAEAEVTAFDMVVGDGDCGTTLRRGAQAILDYLHMSSPTSLTAMVVGITDAVESTMDGTSGALYSIFLSALAAAIQKECHIPQDADTAFGAKCLQSALLQLEKYTPARVGDRTVMDTLIPFVEMLVAEQDLHRAASAAIKGAEATKDLLPQLGRTVYVGRREDWLGKVPDPGAWGLSRLLAGYCG